MGKKQEENAIWDSISSTWVCASVSLFSPPRHRWAFPLALFCIKMKTVKESFMLFESDDPEIIARRRRMRVKTRRRNTMLRMSSLYCSETYKGKRRGMVREVPTTKQTKWEERQILYSFLMYNQMFFLPGCPLIRHSLVDSRECHAYNWYTPHHPYAYVAVHIHTYQIQCWLHSKEIYNNISMLYIFF